MNRLLLIAFLFAPALATAARADDSDAAAARAADDLRVLATTTADRDKLDAIFSDDLIYTHSTADKNTKAVYMGNIVSGKLKYYSITYEDREFESVAPGIVLMRGRGHFLSSSNGGEKTDHHLCFLAVWRKENGAWRFLAWQSCAMPAPSPKG